MRSFHIPIILFIVLIAVASSCKKSSNATAANTDTVVNARIATIQINEGGSITSWRIVYDTQNRVDSIIEIAPGTTSSIKKFAYSASFYTITEFSNSDSSVNKVTLNPDGSINSVYRGPQDTIYISYGANGVAQIKNNEYGQSYVSNYTWINGDIDSASSPSSNGATYFYNINYLWQIGDGISIFDFLDYGRPIIHSKHLMTEQSYDGTSEKYMYKFDNRSRITQLTIGSETYVYTYTD